MGKGFEIVSIIVIFISPLLLCHAVIVVEMRGVVNDLNKTRLQIYTYTIDSFFVFRITYF